MLLGVELVHAVRLESQHPESGRIVQQQIGTAVAVEVLCQQTGLLRLDHGVGRQQRSGPAAGVVERPAMQRTGHVKRE